MIYFLAMLGTVALILILLYIVLAVGLYWSHYPYGRKRHKNKR